MKPEPSNLNSMLEGHPEPFSMPRTIPSAWDLSDLFASPDMPHAEVNGTAFEQNTGLNDANQSDT
jgi:hypothetical protein